jgi:hypothetical protein
VKRLGGINQEVFCATLRHLTCIGLWTSAGYHVDIKPRVSVPLFAGKQQLSTEAFDFQCNRISKEAEFLHARHHM